MKMTISMTDYSDSLVFKFSKEGKLMKTVGRKGNRAGEFNNPSFIKVNNSGKINNSAASLSTYLPMHPG